MFDIGWSEFAVIAVVALIAIGPKELPGVLRMVGQWVAKARKMAGEFQGQFQEAMREAEMADLKKSFDEVKEAASGFTTSNIMTSLEKPRQLGFGRRREAGRDRGDDGFIRDRLVDRGSRKLRKPQLRRPKRRRRSRW